MNQAETRDPDPDPRVRTRTRGSGPVCPWLLLCSIVYTTFATIGWDGIQRCDVGCFQCLKGNKYNFFIGRVWKSTGNYDNTGIQNIKDARAAGIPYVDAYIFPCLKSRCAPAKNQVEATINKLKEQGAKIGMLWLDIERQEWPSDKAKNRQYVLDMAAQAEKMGVKVGVYTNLNNWKEIVGLDFTGLSKYPLWYAHYDGKESFSDFKPFGGWTKPAMKQFVGSVNGPCGVNMDKNWYP